MRVGIVGVGSMGQTHAAGWSRTPAHIVGFMADKPETAAPLAAGYNALAYAGLDDLLADVDVLDVCAPTHLHHEIVMRAAAAGKDIICEKPLARTLPQAREMIAACRSAGVRLAVGHVVRYFPEYALARQKVAAGEIGRPAIIRLRRGTFQPRKAVDNWFLDHDKSGGMILDLMIHDFDYARWVAGEVETVYARNVRAGHPDAQIDHGLAILTHRDGALSHVEGSWAYPPPLFRTQLEIAGSNGWLRFDSGETSSLSLHLRRLSEDAPEVPQPGSPMSEDPYTTQIKSFYEYLAGGAPPRVTAADGLAALQIALAAIESAATGRPVSLEPLPEVAS